MMWQKAVRKGTALERVINLALFSIPVVDLSAKGFILPIKLKQN